MSPFTPSAKRPGLWAWIGLGLVVLVCLFVIKFMFRSTATGSDRVTMSSVGPASKMYALEQAADSFGGEVGLGIPPMAPYPSPMPPIMKEGGSAAVDLDGNTPIVRVIKTGQLMLRVADAPAAVEQIRVMVSGKNGFVESSSLNDSGSGPRSAWMTLRLPVSVFESTMAELKGVATLVLTDSVNGQDVTMEFVDLEADLRNARAEEASYLEILKQSGDIEDVLAVTQRLADVRGRIERIEGRKRFLENRTNLATITVSLTEDTRIEVPGRTWRPLEVTRQAFRDLIDSLQELINFLIRVVIAIIGLLLPIAVLVGLILWAGWKIVHALLRRLK